MQLFRKLAGNIFFKILLAFIALSFVLFGVSGFILGSPNAWVAKVGNKTISYSDFNKEMQKTRNMILQSNKSEEALKYLDSEQFKSDILGRMVNGIIVEKLRDDFGVEASKKLILEAVAKDQNFKDKDGKFDRQAFHNFLAKNGLDEEKYVNLIQTDVVATMIIQTLSLAALVNEQEVIIAEEFKNEKRVADVIKVSDKNIGKIATPDEDSIKKFYEANKKSYSIPEMRKVSYFRFYKHDFDENLKVTDDEAKAEFDKNPDKFKKAESRDLYHILFDKEESAQEFANRLDNAVKSDKSKIQTEFLKLAKELQNKDQKSVTLKGVTQKDMIPDLANPVFKMSVGEHSAALKSPLGFHIFLLNHINPSAVVPFTEVKDKLRISLSESRLENFMQKKVNEIDDAILASNSLSDTAKKFGLSANLSTVEIDQSGQTTKGQASHEIRTLDDFAGHAFAAKKGETSKIFYSKSSGEYYALKVEEVIDAHDQTLDEVKPQLLADLTKANQEEALQKLATAISSELQANPQNLAAIVAKHKLAIEKNKQFSRFAYISYQGRQIPYADKLSGEIFGVRVGEATTPVQIANNEFAIAILRSVQAANLSAAQIERAKAEATENFRSDVLQGYNAFVMKKYPVKVNDKILGKKEQE